MRLLFTWLDFYHDYIFYILYIIIFCHENVSHLLSQVLQLIIFCLDQSNVGQLNCGLPALGPLITTFFPVMYSARSATVVMDLTAASVASLAVCVIALVIFCISATFASAVQFTSEEVLIYCVLYKACLVETYLLLLTPCDVTGLKGDNILVAMTDY